MTRSNFLIDMSSGYLTLGVIVLPVGIAAIASTLAEYALALGFWIRRCRFVVAAIGIGFHVLLTFVVDIFMLHFASIFLYLAFLLPMIDSQKPCENKLQTEQSSL